MTGHLIYTCPHCKTIVDYSCMCEAPRTIAEYVGHATVDGAKAAVIAQVAETGTKTAGARKNGTFGYKAKVTYSDGRVWTPIRRNFPDRESATAYAQKWIDANDSRPTGVRNAKVKIEGPRTHPEGA